MYDRLKQSVINQLGYEALDEECRQTLQDITDHGIGGGFCGFTYYTDTVKFFDDNRADIIELGKNLADDLGEDFYSMVRNFRCLGPSDFSITDIGEGLHDDNSQSAGPVRNAMAWFAAEEVARHVIDRTPGP